MDRAGTADATAVPRKPARVFIACTRCRARKARCDSGTPKCALCTANGVECTYPAVRKTRGPAKKKRHVEDTSERPTTTGSSLAQAPTTDTVAGLEATETTSTQTTPTVSSQRRNVPIFTDFLHPDVYGKNLKELKGRIGDVPTANRVTPLLPLQISTRLTENAFDDVMEEHRIMDMSSFMALLNAQYNASLFDPAGDPPRWAIVNALIALMIRFKTAPGSDGTLGDFPRGFYQNATDVLSDLVLQPPSLLAIQALLAMAIYAQGIPDVHASAMLASNASRQLELSGLRRLSANQAVDIGEAELYRKAHIIAQTLEKAAMRLEDANRKLGPVRLDHAFLPT